MRAVVDLTAARTGPFPYRASPVPGLPVRATSTRPPCARLLDAPARSMPTGRIPMAAPIWHNRKTRQPITRSVVAYDHWSFGMTRLR